MSKRGIGQQEAKMMKAVKMIGNGEAETEDKTVTVQEGETMMPYVERLPSGPLPPPAFQTGKALSPSTDMDIMVRVWREDLRVMEKRYGEMSKVMERMAEKMGGADAKKEFDKKPGEQRRR
jgi:hypothetical protein